MRNCGSCVWFEGGTGPKGLGKCRLYPPQAVVSPVNGQTHTLWPLVGEADWCGEWQESEKSIREFIGEKPAPRAKKS